MNELSNCQFYCLSYYEKNRENMMERFKKLNIECKFYHGVLHTNQRIDKPYNNNKNKKRLLSITYGHLDIINDFYNNSECKYAIICEDDIIIHKDIKDLLRKIIIDFNIMDLDILLLSYLLPYKISNDKISNVFALKREMPSESIYKYYNYPNYLSGTQMYIITKSYAKYILDKYYFNNLIFYKDNVLFDKIFIRDKNNKALIYPMLAIENENQYDKYHKLCHKINYNKDFI